MFAGLLQRTFADARATVVGRRRDAGLLDSAVVEPCFELRQRLGLHPALSIGAPLVIDALIEVACLADRTEMVLLLLVAGCTVGPDYVLGPGDDRLSSTRPVLQFLAREILLVGLLIAVLLLRGRTAKPTDEPADA